MTATYPWLNWANNEIGVRRTGIGAGNPRIIEYWKIFKMGGIKNERVPWCSAFVGAALESVGINTNSEASIYKKRTKDSSQYWLHWSFGQTLEAPAYGCLAVMERQGGGHVGFVIGKTQDGKHLILLGGNQGSAVSIAKFPIEKFIGYVMPVGFKPDFALPKSDASSEHLLK
ncbi:TIGR02594 family protein [Wohlfahrtiimonas larvae]|uniref:TIGR02594 family protein n=1 Tax=Wohlfahrtiimonas larvae TaxID=1157986 RepID=A0ABP9MJ67_9GAMM